MDFSRRIQTVRHLATAAAVLAAAALPACNGDSQAQEPRQLVGVQLHPLWSGVRARDASRELDIAKRAGADVVRIDIGWATLEHSGKGRFSQTYARRVDAFLAAARKRDIRVVATLMDTPCWASRAPAALRQGCRGRWWDRGVVRFPPRRSRDYADAAVYVARRWGDRLRALEIWNEPNLPEFMRSADPVIDYSRMLRSSYGRIKRVKPRLTVLGGSMSRSDGAFLTALFDRGHIAGHYDAISYHPYSSDPASAENPNGATYSLIGGTVWLHDIMTTHGDERGLLWATEAGASTCGAHPDCVSEAEQAERVGTYIRVARQFPYVKALIIYNLRDRGAPPSNNPNLGYGLVRRDLRPKPSLAAFRAAAAE